MALSFVGAVTNEAVGAGDPVVLTMSSTVAAGSLIVVVAGGDSNSISLTNVTDSEGHTWTTVAPATSGSGNVMVAWALTTDTMTSGSDTISVNFSGSNDAMVRGYAFTGVDEAALVTNSKTYTESTTFSLGMTTPSAGVQFAIFTFPFDFFTTTISGWTKFADIQDGTDQCLLGFYKEVSAGTNTASKTLGTTVAYLAAGMVLPLSEEGTTTTTTTPAPGTTTTPPPASVSLAARIIGLF